MQGADARQEGAVWELQSCKCRDHFCNASSSPAICHLFSQYFGSRQSIKCVLDIKDGGSLGNLPVSEICAEEQNGVFSPFWTEAWQGEGMPQSLVKDGPPEP